MFTSLTAYPASTTAMPSAGTTPAGHNADRTCVLAANDLALAKGCMR